MNQEQVYFFLLVPFFQYFPVANAQFDLVHSFLSSIFRNIFEFIYNPKYFHFFVSETWHFFAIYLPGPLYRLLSSFLWSLITVDDKQHFFNNSSQYFKISLEIPNILRKEFSYLCYGFFLAICTVPRVFPSLEYPIVSCLN